MNAANPLFAGPSGAHGIEWLVVLSALIAAAAALLLLRRLVGGPLPSGIALAAVLLPIGAYSVATLHMIEGSKEVAFCGSCHIMTPVLKSLESNDGSLASTHYARGLVPHDKACFTCHSGYGIWGGLDAKLAGVRHMVLTVTGRYDFPLAMHRPFDIDSCLGCHASVPTFQAVEAHRDPDLQKQLLSHEMSCTGICHPAAHPAEALTGGAPAS